MRLRELVLGRYGHLSDVVLTIPPRAGLCVVHGANEAGKSTALSAIGDALFGFGHRTAYDFLHGGPQLRVGFTLAASDGSAQSFVRRKGRSGTLRDADDAVVSESALQRFLGGASRELFDHMFGLNGDRLRAGGATLAQGGTGVGESLFAAGSGVLGLRSALAKLDEEAKALFGDGRGKRRISEAVDAWRTAQREADRLSVPPRAWQEADSAHVEVVAALARVQAEAGQLSAEASRLQRVRRVAPLLARLDAARATMQELADAPHLPGDAREGLDRWLAARKEAERDVARETASAAALAAKRDAIVRAPAVLAAQDAIDRLAELRPVAVQAAANLAAVRLEVAQNRATVLAALAELPPGMTPEAAREAVPAAAVRRAVQRLGSAHAVVTAQARDAIGSLDAALERRARAEAALQALPPPPDPALLRATIERIRGEGRLDSELAQAMAGCTAAAAAATAALAALPLWQRDAGALAACSLPLPAEAAAATDRLAKAADAAARCAGAVVATTQELSVCDAEVARLTEGGPVPTQAVVGAARARRDAAWRAIRAVLDGRAEPPAQETQAPGEDLPTAFEALRDAADRLADQRADEAQRVADYGTAMARQAELCGRHDAALAARDAADAGLVAAQAGWGDLWAPAGIVPASPDAMAEWLRARAEVLRLAAHADDLARQRDQLAARCAAAKAELAAVLPGSAADLTVAAALTRADVACDGIERAVQAIATAADTLQREVAALPGLRQNVATQQAALAAWHAEWAEAVQPLGLDDCSVPEAEAALDAWGRVAEAAPAWRIGEAGLRQMQASVATFEGAVAEVLAATAAAMDGEPAPVAAGRLIRLLAQARSDEADAASLTARIAGHAQAIAAAGRTSAAAEAEIETLRRLAGAADTDALDHVIERGQRRDAAAVEAAKVSEILAAQGDGLDEAALLSEAAGTHPDSIVARLAAIEVEAADLGSRREALSADRTRIDAQCSAMRAGNDAAGAAQDARQALAEAGAGAERYARLHMARVLLRSGIDRFRRAQQGPMLTAAGRHFAALTAHRYTGLCVDEDASGRLLLVAVPASGNEVTVDALSEGTRDQLYLALRVAAVESYAQGAEPLPFIADDLLVHFDDVRAAAAIRLLADLGRTSQVILFSHHDHVAALAEAAGSADIAVIRLATGPDYPATLRSSSSTGSR